MYYNYLRATRCVLLSWLAFIGRYLDPISTNEQCVTSVGQYNLLGQYCENIVFVLTQYSYLIFTLSKLSCNGGTTLQCTWNNIWLPNGSGSTQILVVRVLPLV